MPGREPPCQDEALFQERVRFFWERGPHCCGEDAHLLLVVRVRVQRLEGNRRVAFVEAGVGAVLWPERKERTRPPVVGLFLVLRRGSAAASLNALRVESSGVAGVEKGREEGPFLEAAMEEGAVLQEMGGLEESRVGASAPEQDGAKKGGGGKATRCGGERGAAALLPLRRPAARERRPLLLQGRRSSAERSRCRRRAFRTRLRRGGTLPLCPPPRRPIPRPDAPPEPQRGPFRVGSPLIDFPFSALRGNGAVRRKHVWSVDVALPDGVLHARARRPFQREVRGCPHLDGGNHSVSPACPLLRAAVR